MRPGLGTLTPTPTSLTLGHPAPNGRGKKMGQLSEEPWIEVRGDEVRLAEAPPPRLRFAQAVLPLGLNPRLVRL